MRPALVSAFALTVALSAPGLAQQQPTAAQQPTATGQAQASEQLRAAEQRLRQASEQLQQAARSGDREAFAEAHQAAVQALQDAGFKTKVEREYSDTVPEGTVISTSVPAGRQATKGRTITLTVSRGQELVSVPGVVGNTSATAAEVLEGAGLGSEITERESSQSPGTVLEQNPAAGENLPPGATVSLVVAKERPEIPDVSTGNPTVEEATRTLEDAGYKVKTTDRPSADPNLVGRVIGQSPAAGTRRSTGGTVTIAVVPDANAVPTATPTP
jgi:serine/threonine-protein kinase